jgi:hypothetical protein
MSFEHIVATPEGAAAFGKLLANILLQPCARPLV